MAKKVFSFDENYSQKQKVCTFKHQKSAKCAASGRKKCRARNGRYFKVCTDPLKKLLAHFSKFPDWTIRVVEKRFFDQIALLKHQKVAKAPTSVFWLKNMQPNRFLTRVESVRVTLVYIPYQRKTF